MQHFDMESTVLKEEGPFFTFPSKSYFRHFRLFFLILAYISLSVIDNMVPFLYGQTHTIIKKFQLVSNSGQNQKFPKKKMPCDGISLRFKCRMMEIL